MNEHTGELIAIKEVPSHVTFGARVPAQEFEMFVDFADYTEKGSQNN